jgi:MFS family permease
MMTTFSIPPAGPARPPIVSRALLLRFVSIVASSVGFYLPLAVIPRYTVATGAHGGAGLANGALLVATVLGELVTPRIAGWAGYRWALAAGLVLLGAPALALLAAPSFALILGVGVVRGIGFALTVVAGGALTATLIPDERRGEGLAIVGLVGGIPSLAALPLGVWAAERWGYGIVFILTAAAPLAALVTLPGLPGRRPGPARRGRKDGSLGVLGGLRDGALTRPAAIFAASASAAGIVVTYLPLAVGERAAWVAPGALFAQQAAAAAGRWVAGRLGDRHGQGRLLAPSVLLVIAGMAALSLTHSATMVVAGATAFGTGFGVLQNTTLSLMYARVPAEGYGAVSAIWNAAYDLGMAAGAIGIGMVIATTGFPAAFLATAAAILPALLLVRRDRIASKPRPGRAGEADLATAPAAA